MKTGGTIPSIRPPRRQPAIVPISVPMTNARTVAIPTSPSVHGNASPISVVTGTPRLLPIDTPQCPVTIDFRYAPYCSTTFLSGSKPNSASTVRNCSAVTTAPPLLSRSRSASSGLPGIIRGMKKFSVIAAQRVSTKNPRRRIRYRTTTSSSCSLPRSTPTSGPTWSTGSSEPVRHRGCCTARAGHRGRPASASPRGPWCCTGTSRLGGRDERYVLDHVRRDLLDQLDLRVGSAAAYWSNSLSTSGLM